MTSIAIQGQPGSFHDIARQQFFSESQAQNKQSFREVFAAVSDGSVDFGISAIENSLYGSINEVYTELLNTNLQIIGEIYLRIEHCLIAARPIALDQITDVFSQREALAQCTVWMNSQIPGADQHAWHDTAASVAHIMNADDNAWAAIASRTAAETYGATIVQSGIETNHENYTRFIVLAKTGGDAPTTISDATTTQQNSNKQKTSIIVDLNNSLAAGSLHNFLTTFATRNINLNKIESKPMPGRDWRYIFYVDIDGGTDQPEIAEALEEIQANGHKFTLLGSYAAGEIPQ